MARLTPIQVGDIKRLLDENGELPVEWRWVLFPPEKQEYELVYACKQREEEIIQQTMAVPLQPVRTFGNGPGAPKLGEWHNRLIFGDNLQAMKTLLNDPEVAGKVRLVYIDPPFATQQEFRGSQDQKAYQDKVAGAEFIEFMRKRLVLIRELLSPDGSVYVHLDWRKAHYIRAVLDELFLEHHFQSEIVWQRHDPHNDAVTRYGRIHDVIFWYSAGDRPTYNYKEISSDLSEAAQAEYNLAVTAAGSILPWHEGIREQHWRFKLDDCTVKGTARSKQFNWRGAKGSSKRVWPAGSAAEMDELARLGTEYLKSGRTTQRPPLLLYLRNPDKGAKRCRVSFLLERQEEGQLAQDIWLNLGRMKGGSSYPNEKPEVLMERIVRASSNEGDIVLDAFPGSGTTLAVAEKLKRKWVGIDCGKLAMYTIQKRMLNLRSEIGNAGPALKVKPFTLYNAGHYDFATLKDLPWPDWKFFALQLFECADKPQRIGGLDVDGEKAGAPVLVFNWREKPGEKISEDTIADIHALAGKRIGRKFYIIAPMMAFDFFQDYIDLDNVRYYALKIPYSVIQELHSRDFTAVVQARDATNVNDIQEAYGFSFMVAPEVEFRASLRKQRGQMFDTAVLKTTKFVSHAKIKGSEREGKFETLAMLMLDFDYNGDIFDLDKAYFGDDLEKNKWEATFAPEAVGERVAAIWVDHHGNEFKAVIPREAFGLTALEEPVAVADRPRRGRRPRRENREG